MQALVTGSENYSYLSKTNQQKEGASFYALQPVKDGGIGFAAVQFTLPYKDKDLFKQAPALYDLEFDFVSGFSGITPILKSSKFIRSVNLEGLLKATLPEQKV